VAPHDGLEGARIAGKGKSDQGLVVMGEGSKGLHGLYRITPHQMRLEGPAFPAVRAYCRFSKPDQPCNTSNTSAR
jgi:hypothetical protein